MGIGPLVAWRRASLRGLLRTFAWPGGIALGTGIVLLVLGAGSSIPGLVAYTFAAFVLAAIGLEFVRGTRARRALSSESWPVAFGSLMARNRRRYGGYVVHAAIVLLAIGIAGSSAYDSVVEGKLQRGQALSVGGYTVIYLGLTERDTPHATEVRALLAVERGGKSLGTARGGQELLQDRGAGSAGVVGGRHPHRLPDGHGSVRDRRADQRRRQRLLPHLRQAAREPDLARRARISARLVDRVVAGRAGGAATRACATTRPAAPRAGGDASRWRSVRRSPSCASCWSRCRFCASPTPTRTSSTR